MKSIALFELHPKLRTHSIFQGADPALVDRYLSGNALRVEEFPPDSIAYSSVSEGVRVGSLLSGGAQVHTGLGEGRALLKTVAVGELFGVANLYAENEPFPTQIVTTEKSKILFIDGDAFRNFIENDPSARRNYLAFQSKKIVYLNRKILIFTAGSAEKRLSLFLLEHETDNSVNLPCSMTELSELLGIGRASLYRAMDTLAANGWIEKQGKTVHLLNRDEVFRFVYST